MKSLVRGAANLASALLVLATNGCCRCTHGHLGTAQSADQPRAFGSASTPGVLSLKAAAASNCAKPPEATDVTLRVIRWEFRVAYVGGPSPNGHYINYFTFRYSPSDPQNPCAADAIDAQVCDHDVVSYSWQNMPSCKYLGRDEQLTETRVGRNSIRASGSSMNDCTCP